MTLAPVLKLREAINAEVTLDSFDAETALLGCVLCDNEALSWGGDLVTGEHFSDHMLGWLYDRAREMIARGQSCEPISLDRVAQTYGTLYHEHGGISLLGQLVGGAPPVKNAGDFARIVLEGHLRRQAALACQEGIRGLLGDQGRPAVEIVGELRAALETVEQIAASDETGVIDATDAATAAIANMREYAVSGRPRGLMTGLRCIDRRLNGLKGGALIVVGGRPAMGKTSLGRAIVHGAAVRNPLHRFVFLGIEMGPEEMMQRELASLTHEGGEGIEYRAMGSGSLTPMDLMQIDSANRNVPRNLVLVDCPSLSVDDVRRRVWKVARRGPVGAIVIDYLQLMRRPEAKGRNDAAVIGEMTRALKQIARQAGIAVILLSQLSRSVEGRDDKKPQLADLRESGTIEQDADAVLFPFREFYYVQKAEPKETDRERHLAWLMTCEDLRRRLDVICAKQRQGPEGTDRQRYFAEFDVIEDHNE